MAETAAARLRKPITSLLEARMRLQDELKRVNAALKVLRDEEVDS